MGVEEMLADGWEIRGYSTAMMAAGGLIHSVLLQKGTHLTAINVVFTGVNEIGRTENVISPAPAAKKGFWS